MVAEVAFVEDHDSVDDPPSVMEPGLAEMLTVGGRANDKGPVAGQPYRLKTVKFIHSSGLVGVR